MIKIILTIILTLTSFNMNTTKLGGVGYCDFFPCPDYAQPGEDLEGDVLNSTEQFVSTGISLIFVGIIALGIFLVLKGAVTIIKSQENAGDVEKGAETIKSVFVGLGMIFIGLIGVIIIAAIFDATEIFNQDIQSPGGTNFPFIN